jgi:hypothetical protein
LETNLLVAVLADEMEEAAVEIARQEGVRGITLVPAQGLNHPEHITFFGNTYLGLEVVLLMLLDSVTANRVADRMNRELDLLQPFKGLAFCLPVDGTGGIDIDALRRHIEGCPPADRLSAQDDATDDRA